MTETQALKELEARYASVEALALDIFVRDKPERDQILGKGGASWEKRAGLIGLSTRATQIILVGNKAFHRAMKELSINNRWNFEAQDIANEQFVLDTQSRNEKPESRVKVAQYLNREAGIGPDETGKGGGNVINLNFGGMSLGDLLRGGTQDNEQTITLDPHGNPYRPHLPKRSGDAVPQQVRILQEDTVTRVHRSDQLLPGGKDAAKTRSGLNSTPSPARNVVTEAAGSYERNPDRDDPQSFERLARKLVD